MVLIPKHPETPSFVCQFPLVPASPGDAAAYRIETDHYRRLQNAVLSQLLRQLHAMRNDPVWADGRSLPVEDKAAHYQALAKRHGLDKSGVGRLTKRIRRNPDFKRHTNSAVAQKLGERALEAVRKQQFGKSRRSRFKNRGEIVTLESKANASGIRVQFGDCPRVCTSRATFRIDPECPYHRHAMAQRIKNSRGSWCARFRAFARKPGRRRLAATVLRSFVGRASAPRSSARRPWHLPIDIQNW